MADRLTSIKNINRNTRNWTAKVKVLEKWRPRSAQHSPVKYQKLVLADAEGNKVQAMIYNENIQKLEARLQVYDTYLISNATVKFTTLKYRTVDVDFEWQWTIDASTLIQKFDESLSHEKLLNIDFIPFEQFGQYADTKATIDILAAVVRVHTPRELNKPGKPKAQEIVIINQEMKPSTLTFWDDFITREGAQLLENTDPYPLLIGIHIKVTKYNDKEKVEQLCNQFLAKPIIQIVPEPQDKDFIPIAEVPKAPKTVKRKEYWIQGKISIVSLDQNFWYISCSNCRKAISANKETLFDCFQCNSKKVMAKPRLEVSTISNFSSKSAAIFTFTKHRVKFEVLLTDASGSMTATMFENHAQQYFLVDGKTLMKYAAKKDENVVAIFPKLAIKNQYWIQLKPQYYPSDGVKLLSYNINSIKPALSEDNSKEGQPTNTEKAPSVPTKAKKKLFQADDNPTTTSKEIYELP